MHDVVAFYNDTMKILLTLSDFKLMEANAPFVWVGNPREGNILWNCISFLDDATSEVSRYFGRDKKWVVYQHENVKFWKGKTFQLWEGLTLLHLGGHFAGAQILHWSHGAQERGVLFTRDILLVGMDNKTVSIMRSYPNYVPLLSSHAKRIIVYGAFQDRD
ncbi:hypothetical protein SELMODRAFT_420697 [Selaginella moellendorffii]|uniref:Uncharacterized protein n=1 Tax=Selaginella moellendorffii TaxID=88036 RepID=D8SCU2_SELML|nr:hypothetical protein SELMODRAFT_420697 [Selaginella moellendorffii]